MADRKITDLTALAAGSQATGDLLTIVDVSEGAAADKNKKITVENLLKGIPSNVGIGTSSPDEPLHISASDPAIKLEDSDGTNQYSVIKNAAGNSIYDAVNGSGTAGAHIFRAPEGSSNERMRINSSGNVGIGVSSLNSSSRLTLLESAGNAQTLEIKGANSGGVGSQPGIKFTANNGDNIGGIYGDTNADAVILQTGGTERMRIDSSGRVGIGTTATQQVLTIDVNDSGTSQGSFNGINIANTNTTANNGSAITFGQTVPGNSNARIGVIQTARGPSESQEMFFGLLGSGSYSERMRIDSSGRVGIGTTSPQSILHVKGSNAAVIIQPNADTESNYLSFFNAAGTSTRGFVGYNYTDNYMNFRTNGSGEKMRIDSSGNVGIGVSNPSAGASATSGVAFRPGSHDVWFNHANGVASGIAYAYFSYNSGAIGSITQNGTTAVAYNTTSDYRLKENVVPVTDGITRLQQLKPSRFNFIADATKTVDGFLAHEVQDVVPEAITGEKDAVDEDDNPVYQGIDQSKLVPLLTAALQEAIAEIETLKTKVAALEAG